jgi:hypothetical protein
MQLWLLSASDRAKDMAGETNDWARRTGIVDRGRSLCCLHLAVQS